MADIELTITNQSTDLGDENYDKLFEFTLNGLEIYPKADEIALPWDASLTIEGDNVVLDGYVTAGGPRNGKAVSTIPKSSVMNILGLSVYVEDEEKEAVVRSIFEEHNWI